MSLEEQEAKSKARAAKSRGLCIDSIVSIDTIDSIDGGRVARRPERRLVKSILFGRRGKCIKCLWVFENRTVFLT